MMYLCGELVENRVYMAPQRIVPTKDEILMAFVASCIEWVAHDTGEDYLDVFNRMDRVGLIDNYIIKYYDVIHLESRHNITKDIIETLNLWEKNKAS